MRTIAKRLCRLEVFVADRRRGPSPAEILRERKRRDVGEAYREPPPGSLVDACGRPLSVVDVLRAGRRRRSA
jgi:hypothetical protein